MYGGALSANYFIFVIIVLLFAPSMIERSRYDAPFITRQNFDLSHSVETEISYFVSIMVAL